jgi:hypothetical protein
MAGWIAETEAEVQAAVVVAAVAAGGRMVANTTVLEPQSCAATGSSIHVLPGQCLNPRLPQNSAIAFLANSMILPAPMRLHSGRSRACGQRTL